MTLDAPPTGAIGRATKGIAKIFGPGNPSLLVCFDQILFFDVSQAELTEAKAGFPAFAQ